MESTHMIDRLDLTSMLNSLTDMASLLVLLAVFSSGFLVGYFLRSLKSSSPHIAGKKMDAYERVSKLYYEAQASLDALKASSSPTQFDEVVMEQAKRLKKVSAILHKDMFTWSIILGNRTLHDISKLGFESHEIGVQVAKLNGEKLFSDKKNAAQLVKYQKRLAKKYQQFMLSARKDIGMRGLKGKIRRLFKV